MAMPASDLQCVADSDVHVWCAYAETDAVHRFQRTLSTEELLRAERFHYAKDRDRFIYARGMLRDILARYADRDPVELRFRYGPLGKPALAREGIVPDIRFNLSHSNGFAILAVASGFEVGVDVEWAQAGSNEDGIAEQFFSPNEIFAIHQAPSVVRRELFYRLWTSKEAYLKARGAGLSICLNSFDVSPVAHNSRCVIGEGFSRWYITALTPRPGYVAAIASEDSNCTLYLHDYHALRTC